MALSNLTQGKKFLSVTIASSGTDSETFHLEDFVLCGFITPATLTGTSVSFKGSKDGTNFFPIYDSTNILISVTVAVSRAYSLNVIDFLSWPYIKIVSGSSEAADREIVLFGTRALNAR